MKEVKKPWGKELWIAYSNRRYAGKLLVIYKGKRLSLQYHKKKDETIFVQSGIIKLTVGKSRKKLKTVVLRKGEAYRLLAGTLHRMEAEVRSTLIEFSSPELEDVVRVEDDYGRA